MPSDRHGPKDPSRDIVVDRHIAVVFDADVPSWRRSSQLEMLRTTRRTSCHHPTQRPQLSELDRAVDLCVELKDTSETAVGLAYSAILLYDAALAAEVAAIETRTDHLWFDLEGWALDAAADVDDPPEPARAVPPRRGPRTNRRCRPCHDPTDRSGRAAPPGGRPGPRPADEVVADAHVAPGSDAEGRSLADLDLHTSTGMEVLAIRRRARWLYRPRRSRQLEPGDRLLVVGPHEDVGRLRDLCGDERHPDQLVTAPDARN